MKNQILKKRWTLVLISLVLICSDGSAATTTELKSPNGQLKISVQLTNQIHYSVTYGQDELLQNCLLQLNLQNESLGANPKLIRQKRSVINEDLKREIPLKNTLVKNNCNVLQLDFKNDFSVEFRAFDNGIAYRFITRKKGEAIVNDE